LLLQAPCANEPPVGVAHVLDDVLHDLALALDGDQHLVAGLPGRQVVDAEVEHVPARLEVRVGQALVLRRRRLEALAAGADRFAAGRVDVAAVAVAGLRREARQQVVVRELEAVVGDDHLHQLELVVEVELEGARDRLGEADRRADRRHVGLHLGRIVTHALLDVGLHQRVQLDRRAGTERKHGQPGHSPPRRAPPVAAGSTVGVGCCGQGRVGVRCAGQGVLPMWGARAPGDRVPPCSLRSRCLFVVLVVARHRPDGAAAGRR
jgi:hypothetical protein